VKDALLSHLVSTTAKDSYSGENVGSKAWVVTPREEDSTHAPLFIVGRKADGDLVGFRTERTWT
jgi:hypothetical protein